MKLVLAGLLAASTLGFVAPASAQGIYIGPGVGLGVGADPYYGGRYGGYDYGYGDEPVYQGRSVYRGGHYRDRAYRDGYDQYDYDRGDLDGF